VDAKTARRALLSNIFSNALTPNNVPHDNNSFSTKLAFSNSLLKDFHLHFSTPLDLNAMQVRPHLVELDNEQEETDEVDSVHSRT
jgi:hypothetical protein